MAHADTREYIVVEDNKPAAQVHDWLPRLRPDTGTLEPTASPTGFSPINGHDRDESSASRVRSGRPGGDSLDKLRALPEVRPIPWYEGRELPPEKSTQSSRVQTRGACLLVSRGKVMNPPCNHCVAGIGRFSLCVSSPDWFNGACATCQLATRGNLCTYRRKDTIRFKLELKSREEESNTLNSIPRRESQSSTTPMLEPQPPKPPASRTPLPALPSAPEIDDLDSSSVKKRKREAVLELNKTLQSPSAWKPYVSPYQPRESGNRKDTGLPCNPPLPTPPMTLPPIQTLPQDVPPLINYVRPIEPPQLEAKHSELRYRRIASAVPHAMVLQSNSAAYQGPPRHVLPSNGPNSTRGRDSTASLSPSVQLLQLQQFVPPQERLLDRPQDPPPRSATDSWQANPPATPLIDALPRKKQKQIYGIIGSLQSGIASCKQQAESMQRQLNLLQAALGIENDETEDENEGD